MQTARSAKFSSSRRSAETRNRARDEIKRVINAVDKVRKWEKRWVMLQDSTVSVYKWVPVSNSSALKAKAQQQQQGAQAVLNNGTMNGATLVDDKSNVSASSILVNGTPSELSSLSNGGDSMPPSAISEQINAREVNDDGTPLSSSASTDEKSNDGMNAASATPPEIDSNEDSNVITPILGDMDSNLEASNAAGPLFTESDSQSRGFEESSTRTAFLNAPTDFSMLRKQEEKSSIANNNNNDEQIQSGQKRKAILEEECEDQDGTPPVKKTA